MANSPLSEKEMLRAKLKFFKSGGKITRVTKVVTEKIELSEEQKEENLNYPPEGYGRYNE